MIQSLHIFRKDLRHLCPDLAIYAMLLICYGWAEPQTWPGSGGTASGWAEFLLSFLRPLFPILWLVTITRLVQDESLVGDRQFWVTRPYNRLSLLAAKILFIVAVIALPFAAMECYLLLHAGLHPLIAIPALLLNLFDFGMDCWLPFLAVASVTSSLLRTGLSILGALVEFFFFTLIVTLHLLAQHLTPPFVRQAFITLFAVMFIGILVWQYATRRTATTVAALITAPLLLVALRRAAPSDLLFRHRYPVVAAPRLAFDPDPARPNPQTKLGSFGQYVVGIPIQSPNLAQPNPGQRFLLKDVGVIYTIDAPGIHYVSPWQSGEFNSQNVSLYISQPILERIFGRHVHLHATFVTERFLPGVPQTITATDRFDIPSHGKCGLPGSFGVPFCRYAFLAPPPTVVSRAAPAPGAVRLEDGPATAYEIHVPSPMPAYDPVVQDEIALRGGVEQGTQLSFITYQPADRIRTELDIPAIVADHYIVPTPGVAGQTIQRTAP